MKKPIPSRAPEGPCAHGNHPDMCLDPACRLAFIKRYPEFFCLSAVGVEALIDGARAHGEASEPDHEIGDLQTLLRACWAVMKPAQRERVFRAHREIAEWASDVSQPKETT